METARDPPARVPLKAPAVGGRYRNVGCRARIADETVMPGGAVHETLAARATAIDCSHASCAVAAVSGIEGPATLPGEV
jgi:hypothetical protein